MAVQIPGVCIRLHHGKVDPETSLGEALHGGGAI